MVRKIEVVVPSTHSNEIRNILLTHPSVHHLTYRKCISACDEINHEKHIESVVFTFMVVNKKSDEIIELLGANGVSSEFGTINISALKAIKPRVATVKEVRSMNSTGTLIAEPASSPNPQSNGSSKRKKAYNVSDSLAYDEIFDTIDSQLHLTFDYLALIVAGGVIAACGLFTNSAVAVVASMLVSPLMGPIVGMTFGASINDRVMLWKSFRNEMIGIIVCFLTGFVIGLVVAPILDSPQDNELVGPNTQISSRGEWIALSWGAGIAAPSGVGVALGVSSDQVSALIGVAISAALLPPIVNSGLCLASALCFYVNPIYDMSVASQWFRIGYISMLLFILNWILIIIFGFFTFRMKKLHHSKDRNKRKMFVVQQDGVCDDKEENGHNKKKKDNEAKTHLLSTSNGHTNYASQTQSMLHHRFEKNGKDSVILEAV